MTKFEELLDNEQFIDGLESKESFDDVKAAFQSNGVNLEEELDLNSVEEELSEDDLGDVAGGMSAKDLIRIVKRSISVVKDGPIKGSWKYGKSCGILLRAYYDVQRYGNATRTYSEKQIMDVAKYMGCA